MSRHFEELADGQLPLKLFTHLVGNYFIIPLLLSGLSYVVTLYFGFAPMAIVLGVLTLFVAKELLREGIFLRIILFLAAWGLVLLYANSWEDNLKSSWVSFIGVIFLVYLSITIEIKELIYDIERKKLRREEKLASVEE